MKRGDLIVILGAICSYSHKGVNLTDNCVWVELIVNNKKAVSIEDKDLGIEITKSLYPKMPKSLYSNKYWIN